MNLCHCFNDEPDLSKLIRRFIEPLHEINKFENNLNEQHHQSFYDSISRFLNNDIGTIKELKRRFQKRSDDLDMVFNKHSQIPKNKQTEWKEACNMLTATKSCFQHLTLDYVAQLTLFVSRRRHIVLDSVWMDIILFSLNIDFLKYLFKILKKAFVHDYSVWHSFPSML